MAGARYGGNHTDGRHPARGRLRLPYDRQ